MKTIEIAELQPGRETNRLVAKEVFGLKQGVLGQAGEAWFGGDEIARPLYPYSTQMEFAWKVQEILWESGYRVFIEHEEDVYAKISEGEGMKYRWKINAYHVSNGVGAQSVAETAEMALCKLGLLIFAGDRGVPSHFVTAGYEE